MTSFELTVKMNSKETRPGDGILDTSIAQQKQKARFVVLGTKKARKVRFGTILIICRVQESCANGDLLSDTDGGVLRPPLPMRKKSLIAEVLLHLKRRTRMARNPQPTILFQPSTSRGLWYGSCV